MDANERKRFNRLTERAIRVLSMRDHSEAELRRKMALAAQRAQLRGREDEEGGPTPEEIDRVVAWCHQNNFLDDERFTERFIASRCRKGYGPQRIRLELGQKGIERQRVDRAITACDIDWQARASEIAERKFGLPFPTTWPEKAKIQRYLQARGFFMEDIQSIFRNFDD